MDVAGFQQKYGAWAVVAGASQGLGTAYAEQLAKRGLNLILIARRGEVLEALARQFAEQHKVQVKTLVLDLAQPDSAETIIQQTEDLDVSLLVYNAAFSAVGPFLKYSAADHLKEIDTNIRMPLLLIHYFGGQMLARGRGGIILMSSLSAFQGSAFISNYAATKAYNILLAEGLWEEWRTHGVDVLVCIAGAIRTPNYVASAPKQTGRFSDNTMEPELVVQKALAALSHQPYVIPGWSNRVASFVMRHLMPRRVAILMMGRILRDMYE